MQRFSGPIFSTVLIMALAAQLKVMPAAAQEVFSGASANTNETFSGVHSNPTGTQGVTGNPDCPPPVINGITPKNWSCKTGTQGVQGNAFCPPPVIIINGQPTTPRNWSCPGGAPAARNATNGQWDREHPGFPSVAGATPCQPGGPGGYNWLNNAEGAPLPDGCVRPTRKIITRTDQRYEPAPAGSYIVPPVGPPGSYVRPEGKPGGYIVPPHGAPGSYLNATKNGAQVRTGPGGAVVVTPGGKSAEGELGRQDTQARRAGTASAGSGSSNRQDTQAMQDAMRGGAVYDGDGSSYRQDTQAMQSGVIGEGVTAKKSTTKKNSAAAAKAQAAKSMNDFIQVLRNGP